MLSAEDFTQLMAAVTVQVDEELDAIAIDVDRRLLKCGLTDAELEQWRIEVTAELFVIRFELLEKLKADLPYLLRQLNVH